jgi:hypothetical protein
MYGDDGSNIAFGIEDKQIILYSIKDKRKTVHHKVAIRSGKNIGLKMNVTDGFKLTFFYSTIKDKWVQFVLPGNDSAFFDASFTKQWDRSPRPGLIHAGLDSDPAIFSEFLLDNH